MNDNKRLGSTLTLYLTRETHLKPDEIREMRDNPHLLIDAGYENIEKGDYDEALKLFNMGLAYDDEDPDLLNGLGIVLCELGRLDESKAVLNRAVRLDPEDAITLANLAGVHWEQDNLESAIRYYRMSLEQDEDIQETSLNLISLYLEAGLLFPAFMECNRFLSKWAGHDEATEMMEDIILNMALSIY